MCNLSVFPAALALQTAASADRETLLVIFVGVIALFFLILIAVLIGGAIYAIRLKKQMLTAIDSMKRSVLEKATPIVNQANGLVREYTPKVRSITDDVVDISHTVRARVADFDSTLSHVNAKARTQADRVDGMVSSTLDTTSQVAQTLENTIKVPFREVSGILAGLKAGLDVLTRRSDGGTKSRVRHAEEHVKDWGEEISREARQAAEVNRPVAISPAATAAPATQTVRSVVEAGEEIVTGSTADSRTAPLGNKHIDELLERRSN